jgi:hypothetical protein
MAMTREDLIDQLLDVLDDDAVTPAAAAAPAPATQPSVVTRYLLADHQAARTISEMKEMLRTTADLLEMEAAHLREELDRLERASGGPAVCH